jgi:hypothetical protein
MYTYLMSALQKWSRVKIHNDLSIFNTRFVSTPINSTDISCIVKVRCCIILYIETRRWRPDVFDIPDSIFFTYDSREIHRFQYLFLIHKYNLSCKNLKVRISADYFFVVKLKLPNISKGYLVVQYCHLVTIQSSECFLELHYTRNSSADNAVGNEISDVNFLPIVISIVNSFYIL